MKRTALYTRARKQPVRQAGLSTERHQALLLTLLALRPKIERAVFSLRGPVVCVTLSHCEELGDTLLTIRDVLQTQEHVLDGHPIFWLLVHLLRILDETLVLVENVTAQCRAASLLYEPTGAFWHLRSHLRHLVLAYERLLRTLPVVVCDEPNEQLHTEAAS